MAKKGYRKMTAEERARQEERQRFIADVVAGAAERAGIENTPEARRRFVERVLDETMARQRRSASA